MINNNAASEIWVPVAARARFGGGSLAEKLGGNTRADLWYYHVTEAAESILITNGGRKGGRGGEGRAEKERDRIGQDRTG